MQNNKWMKIISLMIIIILPVLMELYFLIIETVISPNAIFSVDFYQNFGLIIGSARFLVLFLITTLIVLAFNYFDRTKIFDYSYRYRFLLGGIALVGLILFEIHGSSIQYWQAFFDGSENFKPIIGISRSVRSDEWAVNTPMMISQYLNQSGAFPYFSDTIRGALTDVFIVYGQPVKNIVELFRPFHWGYLLLSPAKGLSFFWMGRTIALFLVSFEFAMILSRKNKILALVYAVLMTWSPVVQWWFAVNNLVEMLIFGQLAIIMVKLYLTTASYRLRLLYAFVLLICAGGYGLAFYPAWQVPLAYVFLALLVGVVVENRKKVIWSKKDALILIGVILIFCAAMGYIFSLSYDTILSVLGTVYPGKRFETGGGQLFRYFLYSGNLFFPTSRELPFGNVCELAVFFDFFPMGILLALWVLLKEKKRDCLIILFILSYFMLSGFCLIQWPGWLAKITLLSYTQPSRVFLAVGLLNLLMLIRALTLIETEFSKMVKLSTSIIVALIMTALSMSVFEGYINVKMAFIVAPLLGLSFYLILSWRKVYFQKLFLVVCGGIVFLSGFLANPIVSGTDVISSQEIIKKISEVTAKSNQLWIVDSEATAGYPLINIPIMAGAPTINSTNVYPDLERWQLLDPDGSDEEIYNRYAHITINLIGDVEKTSFVLDSADLFTVKLNTSDLKVLAVGYVLSKRNLTKLSNEEVKFIPLTSGNGFTIYELEYYER